MARKPAAHPGVPKDKLRILLDKLAERAVSAVLDDSEATPRAMSDVLKVAGGYWAVSRKNEDTDEPPSAWEHYGEKMQGLGKDNDGTTH